MCKRTAIILSVVLMLAVLLAVPVNGLSVVIDGLTNERVWLDCHTQVLVSSRDESNNDVSFALGNILYDEENRRIYLSFKADVDSTALTASQETGDTAEHLHGIRINVDNSGFIGVSHNGVEPYDSNLYYIEGAVSEYNPYAFCVEICLGVKLGLHTLDSICVQLVDGNGVPSNAYSLLLPPLPSEETTAVYFPEYDETTKETTTKNNTTRITTTKHTTTEKTTKPDKTTVEKTTAVRTTKEKTTKLKTTKPKTTAKTVTVYVTVPDYVETTVDDSTVSEASSEQTLQEKTYKELKYAAAAGLLVLIFGLCVIINMLNDKKQK